MLDHRKEWLYLKCDKPEKSVYEYSDALNFFVHPVRLQYFVGDRAFSGLTVLRYVLTGNLKINSEQCEQLVIHLADIIKENKVLYLQGIVENEALDQLIKNGIAAKNFHILKRGNTYCRRLIQLPATFDHYFASLPSKYRQDLKRSLKKFECENLNRFTVKNYINADEVSNLFDLLNEVSAKTYQAKNLGLGFEKGSHIVNEFMQGAKLGYANCYILFLDDKPIAWRLGYCFSDTFFSHHIGYDPDFKKMNPGLVLQLYTIQHLIEHRKDIKILDMLYGDNEVKKKLSNDFRYESNYYLFPKNLQGSFNYYSMALFDSLMAKISDFLTRYNIKQKVKLFIR